MERNLDNPLISLRGLAADHCMSRLLQQHSLWLTKIRIMKKWCSTRRSAGLVGHSKGIVYLLIRSN